MTVYNLVSFGGIFTLMAFAWALSKPRRRLNVRVIGWGLGLQLLLAFLIFRAPGSREAFLALNHGVLKFLHAAQAGQATLFGVLANQDAVRQVFQPASPGESGFLLAVQALPVIIFFSALMGLLYYWGIMQWIIRGFAWVFTRLMRISGAESLCAASNIFVGIESATTIRPYLGRMTRSELCTILTAGMATVASSTLAVYVGFLKGSFETIAGHLISASILSAPAAIIMSKLLLPETGEPVTRARRVKLAYKRESSAIESVINGAMAGVKLVVGIVALLLAFLGMIAVLDLLLGGAGGLWTSWTGHYVEWSVSRLLGYVMWPFAVVIGVPPGEATAAAELLGVRSVATEIPAYEGLAKAIQTGALSDRAVVVTAYALCGFAHVASLAIFVGGIAALVPERRRDLASVGPRALLAATLACLMTGAVAGTFFREGQKIIVAPAKKTAPPPATSTAPSTAPATPTSTSQKVSSTADGPEPDPDASTPHAFSGGFAVAGTAVLAAQVPCMARREACLTMPPRRRAGCTLYCCETSRASWALRDRRTGAK